MGPLINEWQTRRAGLRATEAAEHPDVTDALGRVWVWRSGDLYGHDSMAWPLAMVASSLVGWPAATLLDNPNYRWCPACRQAMEEEARKIRILAYEQHLREVRRG